MLLAIDTATQLLSLALHDGNSLMAECTMSVGRQHSRVLAPLIEEMLAQTKTASSDLTALAVSVGPGSYTGVRIGVALAKGMAANRDLPLVPVTTLDTIAAASGAAERSLPLIATVPAGRGRVIWAVYQWDSDAWQISGETNLGSWDELLATLDLPYTLSGEISEDGFAQIEAAIDAGRKLRLLPPAARLRRAGYIAEIAWQRLRDPEERRFPAAQAMPVYLQSP